MGVSEVICGNALEVLPTLPAGSFHCCITSPAYWGLRSYGEAAEMVFGGEKDCRHEWGEALARTHQGGGNQGVPPEWQRPSRAAHTGGTSGQFCSLCGAWRGQFGLEPTPEMYVEHTLEFLRAIRRVLRDDGTVWWNIGDSYARNPGRGVKFQAGPATYLENRQATEGNRGPEVPEGLKEKDLVMIPFRVALAAQADGWWVRSVIIWNKPNPMPESVRDRPTTSHEYVLLLTKSKSYFYDADAIREPQTGTAHSKGTKLHPPIEDAGIGHKDWHKYTPDVIVPGGRNKRTVWTISTKPYPEAHFATFPPDLIEPMILTTPTKCCAECGAGWERVVERGLTTHNGPTESLYPKGSTANRLALLRQAARERGGEYVGANRTVGFQPICSCNQGTVAATILDPFAGTGTVGWVARKHGRDYVLIEMVPEYMKLIEKRLSADQQLALQV